MIKKPALFLDRDGIINVDLGYVHKIKDFHFTKDIFSLLHLFIKKGYLLFIVTNQSGIGRNYYTQQDFDTLTLWMIQRFEEKNIFIETVAYCPHAPEKHCLCRKPNTGMVDTILNQYDIDLSSSWLMGDKQSDIDLAHNSKIENSISIGERKIKNDTHHFKTISNCLTYLEENKIL